MLGPKESAQDAPWAVCVKIIWITSLEAPDQAALISAVKELTVRFKASESLASSEAED